MLAIKPEYTEAYEKNFVGVPCVSEYIIAASIANGECKNIDDVMRRFNMAYGEAVIILDSRPFNKVLDKVIKAKKELGRVEVLNKLIKIINEGDADRFMEAVKTIDYLAAQWDLNIGRGKRRSTKLEQVSLQVDGLIAIEDESIEFVEVED